MERKDIAVDLDGLAGIPFVGTAVHSLDAKKRLTISAEWRALVGHPERLFVLPSAVERCLCVYPARFMAQRLQRLSEKSEVDAEAQDFMRELSANANLVPWDAQGRIRIKDNLLDYAQLKSEVVLVGVFVRFELWSPELWKLKQPVIDQQKLGTAARSVGL
ncbi:MAG TPA: division/cell wall cluster transcriptional repressor MraZ [Kiritimatiellia bacterium]|nr:division/cell wall cluster transcriptional repressor MraZ [Kiritimatiellia bacterium]HMO99017.1 division/cell wall cluster transcriptional repressor MraZ [Kiritimatiellia bacterium]HMP95904.1 division/cell wall cluster transcriptional repressor MraZ [Kiritimatiellia bacterium]